jgi:GNAT superfamily N-acetyltransferase
VTDVTVRPLTRSDLPRLLDLVDGLADYEKLARPDAAARSRLGTHAFANPPLFHTLLADLDGTSVGYAMYFFTYSSFRAQPSLYLEDIFVLPEHRGRGAGLALFRACAAEAVRAECGRMEWQVLNWNTPTIHFYTRLGARQLVEWLPFRLDGDALAAVGASAG